MLWTLQPNTETSTSWWLIFVYRTMPFSLIRRKWVKIMLVNIERCLCPKLFLMKPTSSIRYFSLLPLISSLISNKMKTPSRLLSIPFSLRLGNPIPNVKFWILKSRPNHWMRFSMNSLCPMWISPMPLVKKRFKRTLLTSHKQQLFLVVLDKHKR